MVIASINISTTVQRLKKSFIARTMTLLQILDTSPLFNGLTIIIAHFAVPSQSEGVIQKITYLSSYPTLLSIAKTVSDQEVWLRSIKFNEAQIQNG